MTGTEQSIDVAGLRLRVLCVLRLPFIDKVPGLVSLLTYLSEVGCDIELICPTDTKYLPPSFLRERIRFNPVPPRARMLGAPTGLRLVVRGLRLCASRRPDLVLGADPVGLIAAYTLARILDRPLVYFCLELPEVAPARGGNGGLLRSLQRFCIARADLGVVQDRDRGRMVAATTGLRADRIAVLPNATRGPSGRRWTSTLQERLHIEPGTVVVLHSGGLGPWFDSLELANAAGKWPDSWQLVFHTSFRLEGDPYLEEVRRSVHGPKVRFSTEPVRAGELDSLVSSAHIGVALYSLGELGYRAELMGLAAGKIGDYLKCGLPVVATDIPSIRRYIDEYRCGICVKSAGGVEDAIAAILEDYDTYSENAVRCFDELWAPDRYCASIADRLQGLRHS